MTKPDKNFFCAAPWHVIRVRNIGAFGPCCHFQSDISSVMTNNLQSMTVDEYRNGQEMTEIRQTMLDGLEHPRCSYCYDEEREKKLSLRQKLNAQYTDWNNNYQSNKPLALKEMQFELGNLCNYKCTTCLPELSTQVAADWKKLNWLDPQTRPQHLISDFNESQSGLHIDIYFDEDYIKRFNDNIKDLDSVRILGGEPLINPMLDTYLDLFDKDHAKNVQLLLVTNCSVWRPELMKKIQKFGRVKINLSIDATGDLYEYIRYNGQWNKVLENLKNFRDHADVYGYIPTLIITVSTYNIIHLTDIISEMTYHVPNIKIVLNQVYEPLFLDASIMPQELKNLYCDKIKEIEINPAYEHKTWLRMEIVGLARKIKTQNYNSDKWLQFINYTKNLESIRKNNIVNLVPQLAPYFK